MLTISTVLAWTATHPAEMTLAGTILAGTFNWLAKPRTADELAAMSPRKAAFFRFMAGTFPDPSKVIEAVWQFAKNTHDTLPPKP